MIFMINKYSVAQSLTESKVQTRLSYVFCTATIFLLRLVFINFFFFRFCFFPNILIRKDIGPKKCIQM